MRRHEAFQYFCKGLPFTDYDLPRPPHCLFLLVSPYIYCARAQSILRYRLEWRLGDIDA